MNPFDLVSAFIALREQVGSANPAGPVATPQVSPIAYGGNLPSRTIQIPTMQGGGGPAGGGAPASYGPAAPGSYADWVNTIAKIKGLSPAERDAFYKLGMGESGGRNIPQGITDINTAKGTPAFGPWQVIEPTFRAYMEPGYTNWKDPIASGLASINYQRKRYGTLRSRPGY